MVHRWADGACCNVQVADSGKRRRPLCGGPMQFAYDRIGSHRRRAPSPWPHSSNRHSDAAFNNHCGVRRGFLPRGLSDTCPQASAGHCLAAYAGRCPTTLNSSSHPWGTDCDPMQAVRPQFDQLRTRSRARIATTAARGRAKASAQRVVPIQVAKASMPARRTYWDKATT